MRSIGGKHLTTGVVGFAIGISLASFVGIRVVDRTRKELEWADSMTQLTRSVRNLETHVKTLEHNFSESRRQGN